MNKQKLVAIGGKPGMILCTPFGFDSAKKYPTILFLHGIGERGDGSDPALNSLSAFMDVFIGAVDTEGFIILAPQLSNTKGSWDVATAQAAVDFIRTQQFFDSTMFYLTGISLGGGGVWRYASSSVANCNQFAAIVPVCGVQGLSTAANMKSVPVWAFHAQDDSVVGVGNTTSQVTTLNGTAPVIPAKQTIFQNGNHYIWGRVYDSVNPPGIAGEPVTIWKWFKMGRVGAPVPVPTAVAPAPLPTIKAVTGGNKTITTDTYTLDGTASTGYKDGGWTCISGPGRWWEISATGAWWGIKQPLKLLTSGVYKFKLTVMDGKGGFAEDTMDLTVDLNTVTPPPPPPAKEVYAQAAVPAGATQVIVYTDKSIEFK